MANGNMNLNFNMDDRFNMFAINVLQLPEGSGFQGTKLSNTTESRKAGQKV
jgi:hypothetical protein